LRIGTSVPARQPLVDADAVGADVVQLHLSAPRNWKDPVQRDDAAELAASGRVATSHAPYLVNPASATASVREQSWHCLQVELDACVTVGAGGLVVHAGQAGVDGTVEQAVERWREGIAGLTGDVPLLIENTASGNAAPGRRLADWIELVGALREVAQVPVGVCLDTCHAFAGDPAAATDPTGWVTEVRTRLGGIDVLHVNDSEVAAGGGNDRHAALGDGQMGDALAAMVVAAQAPVALLETPGDDERRTRDLAWLRDLVN
jgi:deoxyribonuclease-4